MMAGKDGVSQIIEAFVTIKYHPQSGGFECAPQRGAFVMKSPLKGE